MCVLSCVSPGPGILWRVQVAASVSLGRIKGRQKSLKTRWRKDQAQGKVGPE